MAKNSRNYIRLAASPQMSDATDGIFSSVDLSAFVDPLHSLAFQIVSADIEITQDSAPYGLLNSSTAASTPNTFGMQIATGAQTSMLRPSNGKVLFHKYAIYMHDVDAVTSWTEETWHVKTLWPEGYIAVVDSLTAMAQATADVSATVRMTYTITGYQKKVSANQLASLLVAQTQT